MNKELSNFGKPVYIVASHRSPLTKAQKGALRMTRPDELLAQLLQKTVKNSGVNPLDIGDVIIGCAFPEAEQGLNVARIAALLAGFPDTVPGLTINRYCSSGLNAIAIAANRIAAGEISVAIAGGVESMSMIPMGGNDFSISPQVFTKDAHVAIAYGMGITAEIVAKRWNINRETQDEFAMKSHLKAAKAIDCGIFQDQIIPIELNVATPDLTNNEIVHNNKLVNLDDGVRPDTNLAALAKLKSAFMNDGSVTAGNSSQMTDGAAALILVSEEYLLKHNLTPLGRFIGFAVCGVAPEIMGIGPINAIPRVLEQTGIKLSQINLIELNEAFAAQSLAVIKELDLNPDLINPYGGAIALGHPLGATGAVLATKLLYGLRRNKQKYGIVTMCVGSGMGAAGIFESYLSL